MLSLFTYQFKAGFIDNAKKLLFKKLTNNKFDFAFSVNLVFDDRLITNSFKYALSTGQWGQTRMGDVHRRGVSQMLKRDTSYFATLSHLRRSTYQLNSSSKTTKLRLLHNTQFGYICPA